MGKWRVVVVIMGAVDVTSVFRESVRKRRVALGQKTPSAEILPKARQRSAFGEEASHTLQKIRSTAQFLRDCHASYLSEDGTQGGMSDAERDDVDAESQRFLQICSEHIDSLKKAAAAEARGLLANQLATHRQAVLQLLYEQLKRVAAVFDEHRGYRLRRATEARDQRLGASAQAAGSFEQGGSMALSSSSIRGLTAGFGAGAPTEDGFEWADDELLEDEELDASEQAQLLSENEALQKELETMVEQAKEAETRMLEIAHLSSSFATKVDEQSSEVETLFTQAEQTSENLVRGNAYLDSAAKHSRDFRLLVLTLLLVSSFGLLFLDWYYPA